jgi:hypothetical protein
MAQQPKRKAVVASALTRLFAWCAEVDADPLTFTPTDLPQFRRWLIEVGTTVPETMVVASAFLYLRFSPDGRDRPDERSRPAAIAMELEPPFPPRS